MFWIINAIDDFEYLENDYVSIFAFFMNVIFDWPQTGKAFNSLGDFAKFRP